jgi:hypothetical protein
LDANLIVIPQIVIQGRLSILTNGAIAQSEPISETELKKLQDKKRKVCGEGLLSQNFSRQAITKTERYQEWKALLKERYGVEMTPTLVEKEDRGRYPQLRLHYFLAVV